jgi:hypothetical protein
MNVGLNEADYFFIFDLMLIIILLMTECLFSLSVYQNN